MRHRRHAGRGRRGGPRTRHEVQLHLAGGRTLSRRVRTRREGATGSTSARVDGARAARRRVLLPRNLAVVGNPVPPVSIGIGPWSLPNPPSGVDEISPLSVLGQRSLWQSIFEPALRDAFGPLWWLVLALVGAGLLCAIVTRGDGFVRVLGMIATVSVLGYLVTPASIGTKRFPATFVYSLHYAAYAPVFAALATPISSIGRRYARVVLLLFVAVLVATQFDPSIWPTDLRQPGFSEPVRGSIAIAAAVLGFVVLLAGATVVSVVRRRGAGVAPTAPRRDPCRRRRHCGRGRSRHVPRNRNPRILTCPPRSGGPARCTTNGSWSSGPRCSTRLRQRPLEPRPVRRGAGGDGPFPTTTDASTWRRAARRAGRYDLRADCTRTRSFPKQPTEALWTERDPGGHGRAPRRLRYIVPSDRGPARPGGSGSPPSPRDRYARPGTADDAGQPGDQTPGDVVLHPEQPAESTTRDPPFETTARGAARTDRLSSASSGT